MATRFLLMLAIMVLELGCGVAAILGVVSMFPYRMDESGIAGIVMIVVGIIIAWLVTLAIFLRKSSRATAARLIEQAKMQAAAILSDATEKALALSSLDSGRCDYCGNPRTGRFCPKCGKNSAANSEARSLTPSHT